MSSLRGACLRWKTPVPGGSPLRDEVRPPLTHVRSVPCTREGARDWPRGCGGSGMATPLVSQTPLTMFPSVPEYFKAPCVFPFTYNDLTYYSCISVHSDYAWCSLEDRFNGRWRYCTANGERPSRWLSRCLGSKRRWKAAGFAIWGVGYNEVGSWLLYLLSPLGTQWVRERKPALLV